MKKVNFKLMTVLFSALIIVFMNSCKDDNNDSEDDDTSSVPVLNEDFSFDVDGNDVAFYTELSGTVWFIDCTTGSQIDVTDGAASTTISTAGSYPFTCNTLISGATYASDTFYVDIETTDLSYLDEEIWQALCGENNDKVWVLDLEEVYFHAIADYYGDDEAGATGAAAWAPWGGGYVSDYDLGGEISFNGETKTVTLTYNGETQTGTFSFDTYIRPESSDYVDDYTDDPDFDLWDAGFTNGVYSYLPLSDSMGTMSLPDGFYFPLDSARFYNDAVIGKNTVNASQFLAEDLETIDIIHVSDSALVVRVKRTYEGDDENKCWMLYNYIVKDYDYPEGTTYAMPVLSNYSSSDLVGTWVYDTVVSQDWTSWEIEGSGDGGTRLNSWTTYDDMVSTLASWGAAADSTFQANFDNEYVFNSDGTCTLDGTSNTYSVSSGHITFGTELSGSEFSLVWISLTGTDVGIINVAYDIDGNAYTSDGIWLGVQNGDKEECAAVHLVKKTE